MSDLLERMGMSVPVIQAPMAGVSSPALAAAVSSAGGLGSVGLGASAVEAARQQIHDIRALTTKAFNINVFCHAPAERDAQREARWLAFLEPIFKRFDAPVPLQLQEIYRSFLDDAAMEAMLLEEKPPVVSFHFGLPSAETISRLKRVGIVLLASATSLEEGRAAVAAGMDGVVAQGYEAGGHRGIFNPQARDEKLPLAVLVPLLVRELDVPVIAAGGIMTGSAIAAFLDLGAVAVQMGTAFICCPESVADPAHRAALMASVGPGTDMTEVISGRPARCLSNAFTALGCEAASASVPPPAYPVAYDAGKALNAAARARGETGYGAQWAGQGAALARALPAAELMSCLILEYQAVRAKGH